MAKRYANTQFHSASIPNCDVLQIERLTLPAVQVTQRLLPSPATDLSAPERRYGVLLLREQGIVLEAFVSKDRGLVASEHALYVETDHSAACRYGWLCRAGLMVMALSSVGSVGIWIVKWRRRLLLYLLVINTACLHLPGRLRRGWRFCHTASGCCPCPLSSCTSKAPTAC